MTEARAADADLYALCWEQGDLSVLMHEGQKRLRTQLHEWFAIDQTNDVEHIAGSMPRVFCVAKAGRFGGTSAMLWILFERAVWFAETFKRPMVQRFTSAWQRSIDEIIGAVVPQCFETAPESCQPRYFGKRGTRPAGLYFPDYGPANGASIPLAGLDVNPDATRGQASDSDVVSEAAFVQKLDYTLRSVLYRQYQGRPWARAVIESSAPKDLDTEWELIYQPDCQRRGAYFSATIEDNPLLSRKEKDEFISAAGGRGHPNCEREYFNVISGDPLLKIVPEFDAEQHVRDVPIPPHAYAFTALDPGYRHLFGLVFGCYDFDNARLIVQDSYGKSNVSTREVAAVIAAREFDLWGTWPSPAMASIPLDSEEYRNSKRELIRVIGWKDLLRGDRCEKLSEKLYEMAQTAAEKRPDYERAPGCFIRHDIPSLYTYYDTRRFQPNPNARVSDVDLQMIRDVAELYGLEVRATTKDDLRQVMVALVRNWIGDGRLVFLPSAGPVIDHVRAGKWAKDHKHFDEHPVYGHYDCLAALVYLVRAVELVQNERPHPPQHLLAPNAPGATIIERLPWQPKQPWEEELERVQREVLMQNNSGRMRGYR